MAPITSRPSWYPLRSVTQRLTSTPISRLPHVIPSLLHAISSCGDVLALEISEGHNNANQAETAVVVHKLKTQISTLLQDRNKEARWSAVVLVKAIIEAGSYTVLRESEKWTRALIGLLRRPEPSSTKKLATIALVRIFALTHNHQSLVREITTPSLPAFITICLKLIGAADNPHTRHSGPSESLAAVALWAYSELLPLYPAAFRPVIGQIRALCLPLTAPISSSWLLDDSADQGSGGKSSKIESCRARQVLVLLCGCAPKNTQSQEWAQSLTAMIAKAHGTADLVFRALKEDWVSSGHDKRVSVPTADPLSKIVQSDETDTQLPGWVGINDGLERLNGLLLTAQAHLAYPSLSALTIPTGRILDLIDRVISALPPSQHSPDSGDAGTSVNPEDMVHSQPTLASSPTATNADAYFPGAGSGAGKAAISQTLYSDIRPAAEGLLVTALVHLPTGVLTFAIRSEIDRTAVLAQSEPLLKASVLNPPLGHSGKGLSSVLPLLARQCPLSQNTEAIIRPRMPMIQPTTAAQTSETEVDGIGELDATDALPQRPIFFGRSMEDHNNLTKDNHQTTERSLELQPLLPVQLEETQEEMHTLMPAKRPLDPEIEQSMSTAAMPNEQPLNLDAEPPLKRTRTNSADMGSPLRELQIPETNVSSQEEPLEASVIAAPENTERSTNLRSTTLVNDEDDSDDSSTPEIDPTIDTEDEEDDQEMEV
ncbi:MAG: hypothetical protein Q9174_004089 [Haloplaca sp. 1 TL-2023]